MEEATKTVNQTMKVLDPMASVIVGTVTGTVDAILKHLTMVQKLSLLLQEAELANKDLQDQLNQQCKDVERFKEDKENELISANGLTVVEAEEIAIRKADDYWMEKYGETIAFIQIDNRECMNFEREMGAGHIPFTMMPVHTTDGTSIYMASGENIEQIQAISEKFENQSLFMDMDQANEIFNKKFVRRMDNLSYPEMELVQKTLARNGISSRITEDANKNSILVAEREIDSPMKEKMFINAIGTASMQNVTRLQKAIGQVHDKSMKAFEPISQILNGEKVKGVTIYDSAHPENYIVLKNGGALVYDNQQVAKELDLSDRECVHDLEETFHSYVLPISTNSQIQEMSTIELAKPYASMSILEQMNGMQQKYIEHLFEEGQINLQMLPDSNKKPELTVNSKETESLLGYDGNASYMAGIIESGRYRVMEEVGILNITNDSDNTVTALSNNIEMDASNMQSFVDKVRSNISKTSLSTEMHEKEMPAIDDGRADVTIEDRENDIDYGNGDYGSRFNDDPNYDINKDMQHNEQEPDLSDDMF